MILLLHVGLVEFEVPLSFLVNAPFINTGIMAILILFGFQVAFSLFHESITTVVLVSTKSCIFFSKPYEAFVLYFSPIGSGRRIEAQV